ncbi:MAG: hypothetical protein KJ964_08780 [Verrucomicrobia bacterium]|nr:hypothetical protein [Verrucomicrobiota bacterium]MBU1734701.1 hypothetical protein [Verrucomicrobiota bacterium]MBU1856958.1 hypothetical protein [Verrucomicrobiota bacterium]
MSCELTSVAPLPQQYLRARMNAYPVPVSEGESAITTLVTGSDGRIYGVTAGENCHLFAFCSRLDKTIRLIATFPGPTAARNLLALDADLTAYVGVNSVATSGAVEGTIHALPIDVTSVYYEEALGETVFKTAQPAQPLGAPVAGEELRALLYHRPTHSLLGLTLPGAKLFRLDLATGQSQIIATVASEENIVARFRGRLASRELIATPTGEVYGTGEGGRFFRYRPETGDFALLECRLPGLAVRQDWNAAECLCKDDAGQIYGGTTDGYLFRLDPASQRVTNFGKPSLERPLVGLTWHKGVIYGVCGGENGLAHLFAYEIAAANFTDLGMLNYIPCEGGPFGNERLTPWSAWRIGALTQDAFGTIYLGENDSRGHLFSLFCPENFDVRVSGPTSP